MLNIVRFTFIALIICLAQFASAQMNYEFTEGKFMIKGTVVDIESKVALPFANIKVTNTGKGVTCDRDGNFTLYVSRYDTLRISNVGYITKVLHVYDLDTTQLYTLQFSLIHDFIKMKDMVIYPYRNKKEFEDAFMAAKDVNKIVIPGIAPPKYSNKIPKTKLTNPISFIYDRMKKKRAANPDFKP